MAAVQLVLNHHECVLALLEGLAVEELSQLGQVLTVEPDSHGQVLVGCCELVADLLIQKVVERLGHMVSPYMVIASGRRTARCNLLVFIVRGTVGRVQREKANRWGR